MNIELSMNKIRPKSALSSKRSTNKP